MESKNDPKMIGRRRTLKLIGVGAATSLIGLVAACKKDTPSGGGDTKGGSTAMDCNTEVDEASKTMRKTLQYKKEATDPAKRCSSCAQYDAGKYGECGGCKLFTGPVRPNGGCLSFAPKEAGAGTPT